MRLVRFFDSICIKMGQAFGIIFKIIIPFLVTMVPIDRVCAFTLSRFGLIADGVAMLGFLILLILYPRIASIAEFIIIGFALIFTIGFGTIHAWWAWAAMTAAFVFLCFKVFFLFIMMIRRAEAMDAADAEAEGVEYSMSGDTNKTANTIETNEG